jgi:predicted short-subunit dehydrogenase-like oxidoreductase (DUF2520 family)
VTRTTPTAVIGAGRLARALLPLLGPAGHPVVAVASRRIAAARSAARSSPGAIACARPAEAADRARLVLLAVPDAAIAGVARDLARNGARDWRGRTVLHHAGALGLEPLAALAKAGAAVGVLHPLQCLAGSRVRLELLRGARARVEGDARGLAAATRLARRLGLVPLRLHAGDAGDARAAYHAAASVVSNDLVALLDLGVALLARAGIGPRQAIAALLPLAHGTLTQAAGEGPGAALTGPVVRGDLATLRSHLAALARVDRDAVEIHRLLSVRLARVAARRGGRASPRRIAALRPAGARRRTSSSL